MSGEKNDPKPLEEVLFQNEAEQYEKDVQLARLAQERLEVAMERVMNTEEGRAIVWDILAITKPMERIFENSTNVMVLKEGKRHVGIRYFKLVFTPKCMPLYFQMLDEASKVKRKLVEIL